MISKKKKKRDEIEPVTVMFALRSQLLWCELYHMKNVKKRGGGDGCFVDVD